MYRVEKHVIRRHDPSFKEADSLCFKAKNLKNATTYAVRQHYFQTKEYLPYVTAATAFAKDKNPDFTALPAKVAQCVMKDVDNDFRSFFAILKKKRGNGGTNKVSVPGYLPKETGRSTVRYNNQALSRKALKRGIINPSMTTLEIKTLVAPDSIVDVRLVHNVSHIAVIVTYKHAEEGIKADNHRWLSIDLGVSRFAMVASNVIKPMYINGNGIKSINQWFNKKSSKVKSMLEKATGRKTSNKLMDMSMKRSFRIGDFIHKASASIVKHALDNDITNIVVGLNKGWKDSINIGDTNNQKFCSIPHSRFVDVLAYKCQSAGLSFRTTEESYTSKCSFIDGEALCKQAVYAGKRVKRGSFVSSNGTVIHADVNGALNILRKAIGDFSFDPLVYANPVEMDINFRTKVFGQR
jgi:IS605 OrfB family transposase